MSTLETIRSIVAFHAGLQAEEIDPDMDLLGTGVIDSMAALRVINDIERTFDLFLDEHVLDECDSIRDLAAVVDAELATRRGGG